MTHRSCGEKDGIARKRAVGAGGAGEAAKMRAISNIEGGIVAVSTADGS